MARPGVRVDRPHDPVKAGAPPSSRRNTAGGKYREGQGDCMDNGADPGRIRTLDDLRDELELLRRAEGRHLGKDRLSVQDLTRLVERHHDREVPRSTLANYLAGRTLPPSNVYEAILRALGVAESSMRGWADAWDRLYDDRARPSDPADPADAVGDVEEPVVQAGPAEPDLAGRRKRTLLAVGVLVVLVAGVAVAVAALTSTSAPPSQAGASVSAEPVEAGECPYSPVGVPIRVRPRASFGTGTDFRTISSLTQVVVGSCHPVKAELGTTCGTATPVDTWIRVRFPYPGWVFAACLVPIAP
ncbi:XRE family transcriptional regulator [Amycolatopsis sp. H20-H5]|uniref:XRE family transcriptional regulator n=1 Tax=Amycolatopsis sp. H20-H5 TaxID=3046309 RepID=UPI002DBB91D6|nr:XRE family transcriptional regulator [Amycolatopsis sp. H20-H5]MEC3982167.1 XRE family transcriptional regulator [Amycolatopsis sp. H20-H5]